jgi:ABC-2 type transport system permease protein
MTIAALRGEWFKLVRRPAIWITAGLLVALVVVVGYLITYLVATHPPQGAHLAGADIGALRAGLYPDALVRKSLDNASTLDGVFALIVGVLAQGSEYAWQTVKTANTQLPGRVAILIGRMLAVSALMLLLVLSIFALDGLVAFLLALADGTSAAPPSASEILKGIGADWLIFEVMAMLGFGLATLFRQSAMAIGLGLAYSLLVENLLFGLLGSLGTAFKQIHDLLPIASANHLQQSFGQVSSVVGFSVVSSGEIDVERAVVVLLTWIAVLAVVSAALTRFRDIT